MKIINKIKVLNLIRSPAQIININFSHIPFSFPTFESSGKVVLIILQDIQKLLSIILSYSFIVSEIERTYALNSSRLFLYLYQMLIEIPFLKKKSIYLPHWCDCFYVIADCLDPIRRVYYTNIELGDVYEGPATIPSPGYRSHCISLKI